VNQQNFYSDHGSVSDAEGCVLLELCGKTVSSACIAGGILHSHLDSTVDVGFLMNLMLAQPGMHIRTPEPVTKLNFKTLLPEFLQMSPNHVAQANNIVSESYPSNEWVAYKVARDNFSADLGGPSGFDRFIRGTMTIEPNQAYKEYNSHRRVC